MSTDKLSPALDPSTYLAMSANLASGMGDPTQLMEHSDVLLSHCQAGDYTVMLRHHNSLVIAGQMAAHSALHKAMQCDSPEEYDKWMASAKKAQALSDAATLQVRLLTDSETKLLPYRHKVQAEATATARIMVKRNEVRQEALRLFAEHKEAFNAKLLTEDVPVIEFVKEHVWD